MPAAARVVIKTSIACLALGAVLGALLLINRWLPLGAAIPYLRVAHVHLLLVGWLSQLIVGVAWWLFPPLAPAAGDRPARQGQALRGSEPLLWATYVLLNAAVVLRAVADPLYSVTRAAPWGGLVALSGLCLALAALLFVANLWGRVRELAGRR